MNLKVFITTLWLSRLVQHWVLLCLVETINVFSFEDRARLIKDMTFSVQNYITWLIDLNRYRIFWSEANTDTSNWYVEGYQISIKKLRYSVAAKMNWHQMTRTMVRLGSILSIGTSSYSFVQTSADLGVSEPLIETLLVHLSSRYTSPSIYLFHWNP